MFEPSTRALHARMKAENHGTGKHLFETGGRKLGLLITVLLRCRFSKYSTP